jgi:large repetitive protein
MTPRNLARAASAALLATCVALPALAQVRPGSGGFGTRSTPADDALDFHVLQRTSFGPTPESLARIRAMGVDAYLWEQLHPEAIDDSAVEAKLAAELPPTTALDYQWAEVAYAYLVRAAHSQRQLQAVTTQFWENHFDTAIEHGNNDDQWHAWALMEQAEDDELRAGAFGRFRDLLETSAKSQAMMWFLDNYQNTVRSNNENYARELMELHTLGVDCGYDQFDVEQVTRIFTGWSGAYFARVPPNPCDVGEVPPACDPNHYTEADGFFFNNAAHDNLPKPNPSNPANPRADVLGTTFPAGGAMAEGLRVLDILSRHPCTAQFLSRKLIEHFVMDAPSEEYVDRIAAVFLESDGDVTRVLWAIFQSPEFRDPRYFGGKVKTPMEQCLSAYRAVGGQMRPAARGWQGYEWPRMWRSVSDQGMNLFGMTIPTGYPEVAGPWVSANSFLNRWKYADELLHRTPGSDQVETDPFAGAQALGLDEADAVLDHYAKILLGTTLDDSRRAMLRSLLVNSGSGLYDPADGGQTWRLRETLSNMLGFPEFNKQ